MLKKWQPTPMSRDGSPPEPAAQGTRSAPLASAPAETIRGIQPAPGSTADPARNADRVEASTSFGPVAWKESDIIAGIEEFLDLYDRRPILGTDGSMGAVGLLGVWFMLRALKPHSILECGVNKGLTTWLMEKGSPGSALICMDRDLSRLEYRAEKAEYAEVGFLEADLVPEGDAPLAVFDDHADAIACVRKCLGLGIRHILFDDNYPEYRGSRHLSVAACLNEKDPKGNDRFPEEKRFLMENLETYYVFPPVFEHSLPITIEGSLIQEPSLLGRFEARRHQEYLVLHQEMPAYRWLTYLKLK
ncbi:MAG: hypothetical protein JWP91_1975 [Fibrobacteres bacterium]|nr:hypothetical protein [Fibrobacterota bacterium]